MNSHNEIQYERELRKKEKEIKQFNEQLKISPQLLNNELYLFEHMSSIRLRIKQLPIEHIDNILLITEYFKYSRETINFKYIKPEILNNKIFLTSAIKANPELYFIISEENKKIFKQYAISNDKEYLKYLNKEDYDNPEIVNKITFNFKYFEESLSCINEDMLRKLITGKNGQYVEKAILELNIKQCHYLKSVLRTYMEENKKNKGKFWFEGTLQKNPYLYTILDKEEYKDDESKKMIIEITGKYHNLFKYLPKEWKKDLEIITKIIMDESETSHYYREHGMVYHSNVKDIALVLNEYEMPEKFIDEKCNEMNMKLIRKAYPYLSIEWRNQERIIRQLFKERDNFEVKIEYCKSIPNENLATNLITQLKTVKDRTLENVGDMLEKIINYHYITEKLVIKNTNEKKLKI